MGVDGGGGKYRSFYWLGKLGPGGHRIVKLLGLAVCLDGLLNHRAAAVCLHLGQAVTLGVAAVSVEHLVGLVQRAKQDVCPAVIADRPHGQRFHPAE